MSFASLHPAVHHCALVKYGLIPGKGKRFSSSAKFPQVL
jgi:hypothetical protein